MHVLLGNVKVLQVFVVITVKTRVWNAYCYDGFTHTHTCTHKQLKLGFRE